MWSLVSGLWSLVSGLWSLVPGPWSLVSGKIETGTIKKIETGTREKIHLLFRRAANTRWNSITATRAFRGDIAQRWAAGVEHAAAHLELFPIVPKSKSNRKNLNEATT